MAIYQSLLYLKTTQFSTGKSVTPLKVRDRMLAPLPFFCDVIWVYLRSSFIKVKGKVSA